MNSVTESTKLKMLPHVPTWYRESNEGTEAGKELAMKRAYEIANEYDLAGGEYIVEPFDHIDFGGCRIYSTK